MTRIAAAVAAFLLVLPAFAADLEPAKKEVKLTGTLVCGKCKLGEDKKCTNVLQVKDGEKTVKYWLDDRGIREDYHVCGGDEKTGITVSGTLTEKDGKKLVKPTKVEEKK
jgi:hypothetical protein